MFSINHKHRISQSCINVFSMFSFSECCWSVSWIMGGVMLSQWEVATPFTRNAAFVILFSSLSLKLLLFYIPLQSISLKLFLHAQKSVTVNFGELRENYFWMLKRQWNSRVAIKILTSRNFQLETILNCRWIRKGIVNKWCQKNIAAIWAPSPHPVIPVSARIILVSSLWAPIFWPH